MAKKVLFVTYKLQSYRIPILDIVGRDSNIDLTVLHSSKKSDYSGGHFEEKIISFKKTGNFTSYNKEFTNLIDEFDVIVCMFYLFNLSFLKLALKRNRKIKLIFWGIGVRASYNSTFDAPTIMNNIRYFLARRSDAMLFYSDYARDKYIKKGLNEKKLFVMNNTVEVLNSEQNTASKDKIIFIGSLYKQKKIFELLESYREAVNGFDKKPYELHIVGGGQEFETIQDWIKANKLSQYIKLHGAVFEEEKLSKLFSTAYACISPGQAGLSVLKSFGYGVAFITHENAITGGERLNIVNGKNGLLFSDFLELPEIIMDIFKNPEDFVAMGKNAKLFYNTNRTPQIMANGFIDAVDYVTTKA
ncbi:glycosyltransferase [uncultured Allomuricauda sp.]|uniref:glycosyltransferase n=1 Tax=Flagellimonas sp. W118 TaxID=3410791 RepID=UPI002627E795|nr:glycosyltransferase [uncultured Allomuricauda sp.]